MTPIRILFALPLGLIFGSFLTVVISRVPAGESVVAPRSRCPECGAQLRAVDNIPVLSYLFLGGRCHSCGTRISPLYPLIELGTAGLFVGASLAFEPVIEACLMALFLGLMLAIAVIDARHKIIPNRLTYPGFLVALGLIALGALGGWGPDLASAVFGCLVYGGGLLLVALISPKGMGMGDVKLTALIGLVLGSLGLEYVAVAAGLGILIGGVVAVGALAAGASRKSAVPFGPSLATGAILAAFLAPRIADAYLNLFT